jgi:hypothetical protein
MSTPLVGTSVIAMKPSIVQVQVRLKRRLYRLLRGAHLTITYKAHLAESISEIIAVSIFVVLTLRNGLGVNRIQVLLIVLRDKDRVITGFTKEQVRD